MIRRIDALLYRHVPAYRRWIMRRAHQRALLASEVVLRRESERLSIMTEALLFIRDYPGDPLNHTYTLQTVRARAGVALEQTRDLRISKA